MINVNVPMSSYRLQELTVCTEDTVDVHDIELIQYINVDCSKLKRLLQGKACYICYLPQYSDNVLLMANFMGHLGRHS